MTTAELLERYEVEDPADLDPIPKGYELVDGQLVEKPPMGAESGLVLGRLFRRFDDWCESTRAGIAVTGEVGYRCFRHKPRQVRKPDVSVILCDPDTFVVPREDFRVVPALVVEVVSPNETVEELSGKVDDFLAAGTALAWVVEPIRRAVTIYRADSTVSQLRDPADLTGETVLPGFTTPLAAFLPRRPAAP
jgi:Uma2 family endonuclease